MNVSGLNPHVKASEIAPERLANNAALTEQEKIGEASRQFEAILLRQILEASQKPVIGSKLSDNSAAAGIYRDMITTQLADSISKSGGLGLAQTFEGQLTKKKLAETGGGAAKNGVPPLHATAAHAVRIPSIPLDTVSRREVGGPNGNLGTVSRPEVGGLGENLSFKVDQLNPGSRAEVNRPKREVRNWEIGGTRGGLNPARRGTAGPTGDNRE